MAASKNPSPSSGIIAAADAIQRAVLTREELNGALGRLGRAGYVTRTADGKIGLSDAGRTLLMEAASAGPSYRSLQRELERRLGATPWSQDYLPQSAADSESEIISEATYNGALRANRPV